MPHRGIGRVQRRALRRHRASDGDGRTKAGHQLLDVDPILEKLVHAGSWLVRSDVADYASFMKLRRFACSLCGRIHQPFADDDGLRPHQLSAWMKKFEKN
jgi:hypothetical protein